MSILDGVTVLDFTRAHSGPFCTMNLSLKATMKAAGMSELPPEISLPRVT
jgi:hypothetical protein